MREYKGKGILCNLPRNVQEFGVGIVLIKYKTKQNKRLGNSFEWSVRKNNRVGIMLTNVY